MCGIFGYISSVPGPKRHLRHLARDAEQRGKDSSGFVHYDPGRSAYRVARADHDILTLLRDVRPFASPVVLGHSRLITNGLSDNQPVVRGSACVIHNGIIVNVDEVWERIGARRDYRIDSEVLLAIAEGHLADGAALSDLPRAILSLCKGVVACAIVFPGQGKLLLFSNNGSLYVGNGETGTYFASERFPLAGIGCTDIRKVLEEGCLLDIPVTTQGIEVKDHVGRKENLIPELLTGTHHEERLLQYPVFDLRRCTRCILPETMPFIEFDSDGVCNYCRTYRSRNTPKPKSELFDLVAPYRRAGADDCIVPFSGGRDSCYSLHLIVRELGMKPIAYTYDWGMVTDLGRRNISRMCAELGVENIIVAADISRKRRNIAMNLRAWLQNPDLGMVSILTAGDKHFFKHVETVKRQTGIQLNLWGINPLEVTHFKAGFLGIPPDFAEKRVYTHGAMKQLRYQYRRLRAMLKSPTYFNRSLADTLSGEYYRSFTHKSDYFHVFDYWRWSESLVDSVLDTYGWEKAVDTNTTWRIGDGTAAFYNYIYYTVAGFTEHDTFRSNQIREGDLTREEALALVQDENRPRYPNLRWYLDAVGIDFTHAIEVINRIPKLAPVIGDRLVE